MIRMNNDIGILVGPLKAERKEVDLLFLLPFLVYMPKVTMLAGLVLILFILLET